MRRFIWYYDMNTAPISFQLMLNSICVEADSRVRISRYISPLMYLPKNLNILLILIGINAVS